jgi:hypothetical protein
LSGIRIQGLPDPEFPSLVLEIMPHLIQLQDDRSAGRLRLLVVLLRKGSEPVEHGLGRYSQEERNAMHGEATQIQEHCVDLHRERLTAWGGTRKLIPTLLAELLGLAGDRAVVDEPITLAVGTYLHRYSPSQT